MNEAPVMPVKFTRHNALQAVKKMYGSVDDLIQVIADEHPDYLSGYEISPEIVAETLGIPMHAFLQIINHASYQSALDSYAASQAYNLQARIKSMHAVAEVATGNQKLIMSPKGDAVYVDRDVSEMIAADKHLRNLQGRPLETGKGNAPGGITIQFGDVHEETHQHVHLSQGDSRAQIQQGGTSVPAYRRGELDWGEDRNHSHAGQEAHQEPEPAADTHIPEAWGNEEQPRGTNRPAPGRNHMGSTWNTNREADPADNPAFDDTAYQPPQPGSGPPKGQARAYSKRASGQPFQSHDVEIVDRQTPTGRSTSNRPQAANMDKAERIRKIGYGLHQTPPAPSAAREARGTDEAPDDGFGTFLGGDTPITGVTKTQTGEDADAATERRADQYKASREEKLRQYLNRDRLVKGDED